MDPNYGLFQYPPLVGKFREELKDRCVYNSLSDWVAEYCREMEPEYITPMTCLPFAVDTGTSTENVCSLLEKYGYTIIKNINNEDYLFYKE